MKPLICLSVAGLIAGCATTKQVPVVKTVRVEVPVIVQAQPPASLLACGSAKPEFRFYAPADGSKDVLILEKDQPAFQAWINEKMRCIDAWQEWAK